MSTITERDQLVDELRASDKLLLTTHENPDGDALGSLAALAAAVSGGPAAEAAPPVRIDVQLDWKANAQFAGLLVAKEKGWYAEVNLDVAIHPNDFKRPYIDVVASSDHTIGSSESRSLVAARGRGAPVRAVATIFQGSPIVLLSKAGRGIATVEDLEGKTIGIHRLEDVGMLDVLFAHDGVKDPKYQWKKVGFNLQEFLADRVDVVQGYSVSELVELRRSRVEVNALPVADHGWVDYSEVLFTSEQLLQDHPEAVGKFLAVTFRGWHAAMEDMPATARMIVAKYSPEVDAWFVEDCLKQIEPLLTKESPRMGTMRPQTWEAIFRMFRTYHLADTPKQVADLVDLRFMPQL